MSGWVRFEGRIEPLVWGRSTYTILRLPDDAAAILAAQGAKRVEGEMNDHPVNLALTRAPVVDGVFLWAGRSLLDQLGIEPGEPIEVRLRTAPADAVETPDDVDHALHAAGATEFWDALTPGKRRGLLYRISTAKTLPTRAKRIAALTATLTGGGA
jgi:hypothetical protein